MSEMEKSAVREEMLKEYYFIEDLIDRFDHRSLMIKSWSVTFTSAVFAASLLNTSYLIALVASVAALAFWYLEALWKYFQIALSDRVLKLEVDIREGNYEYEGPRIAQSFKSYFAKDKSLFHMPRTLRYRNVMLPHILIAIGGVFLAIILY